MVQKKILLSLYWTPFRKNEHINIAAAEFVKQYNNVLRKTTSTLD